MLQWLSEPSVPLGSAQARLVGWLVGLASEPTLSLARLASLKSLARLFANPVLTLRLSENSSIPGRERGRGNRRLSQSSWLPQILGRDRLGTDRNLNQMYVT